ncbi:E6 [Mastomys coucha papillomavirus 2]|uniref:Protein E6 n=1 Tax=Mastomys coucha papillomavirus 2 TaxID=392505 RepID=Q06RH5_9PAPI|nr:E6 [Mastomys coucha papillomavirus 2]ABG56157.1 E6 [Mastomys coucha papillomavirus 2]
MDSARSYTLDEILRYLNVDLAAFTLLCAFCDSPLDFADRARFAVSQLKVLVKDFAFAGACIQCRRLLAKEEARKYSVCVGEADFVEAMTGKHIVHVTVRCVSCLGLLSATEKLIAKADHQPFNLVRHTWRGTCKFCKEL